MISTLSRLFKFKLNSVSSFSVVGQGSHNGHLVPAEQVLPQLNGGVNLKEKNTVVTKLLDSQKSLL